MGYLLISMDVAVFVGVMYCVVRVFIQYRKQSNNGNGSGKELSLVRVQPKSPKRQITLNQIQKAVDKDKVVKFEMVHEQQHKASLDAIRVKKKVAQARVRMRLIERRKNKELQKQSKKQKNEEAAPNPKATVLSSRKLSQDELAKVEKIRLKLRRRVKTEAKLKSIFIRLDFDHNGTMSKMEFAKLLKATLPKKNVTEKEFDMVWNAIWQQRKHGDDDEMDASTMNHWLELD